ncbi:MAG: hypothetical protein M3R58_12565 [Pseudomonadota bacterium]|nr:hypothetical protein [Pseudomonadota bacterium]
MKALRRLGFALWLAIALVVGQHAAALHDLAHVSDKATHKQDSKSSAAKCGECFACAQLAGGAAPTLAAVPPVSRGAPIVAFLEQGAATTPSLGYRSRAPPTLP